MVDKHIIDKDAGEVRTVKEDDLALPGATLEPTTTVTTTVRLGHVEAEKKSGEYGWTVRVRPTPGHPPVVLTLESAKETMHELGAVLREIEG